MIFKLENVNLSFSEKIIFKNLNFIFNSDDKIGIVGNNGLGKSSFFNIILRNIDFSGKLFLDDDNFGYLMQDDTFADLKLFSTLKDEIERLLVDEKTMEDTSKYNDLLSRYNELILNDNFKTEKSLIKKFNFSQELYDREVKENFSGGEATKFKLIKLFSNDYNYYLLDEPSNHLDNLAKRVLVNELKKKTSYIIISHDVDLLNKCCNKIIEIKDFTFKIYSGNYEKYLEAKEKEKKEFLRIQTFNLKEKNKLIRNIDNLKDWSSRKLKKKTSHLKEGQVINDLGTGKGSSSSGINDTSKKIIKMRNKLDSINIEEEFLDGEIKVNYCNFKKPNKEVLLIKNLNKSLGDFELNVENLEILNNEKVLISGNNGCGKSTLLKLIIGEIEKDNGLIRLGDKVNIGYLSQKNENLNFKNSILKEVLDLNLNFSESEIRKYLGKFLFKGDSVFKKISDLSGGEKIRLSILKLILNDSNFLILDEPSNHLDITSKDILANALNDFPGCILIISHDKYFTKKFVNRKIKMENGEFIKK